MLFRSSRNSTVMACVGAKARAIAQLPIKIMAKQEDGTYVDAALEVDVEHALDADCVLDRGRSRAGGGISLGLGAGGRRRGGGGGVSGGSRGGILFHDGT